MKKRLLILFLFLVSCLIAEAQTVYKTKTGTKYHNSTCRYLKSSYAINVQEAIQEGLTACSVCNPAKSNVPQNLYQESLSLDEENSTNSSYSASSSIQCTGTTKGGARCRRMTKAASGRCHQH